ncbi:MAG: 2-hydroxyacyl-CoA dehydratase family protein, partial [Thermodesulfobacteriota bacterium]|nr:2-hydroxyacyl-CoA dehydratase family protein [Thermodesulfobacteriota bacterium]
MEALEKLKSHLNIRLDDLGRAKKEGVKIVGYPPGGYLPEELVLACEAIPICLVQGGDHSVVEAAESYICRWIDPFCRAQIGYGISGKDPYYDIIDLMVIPITDNHIRAVSDCLAYNTDRKIFPFGVPHKKNKFSLEYYAAGIKRLKQRLESFTGVKITDSRLGEAIKLCNRERELLRKISLIRKSEETFINAKDFVFLNHASFLADKRLMVEVLELLVVELEEQSMQLIKGPRILLTGSTLAQGDSNILDMIDEAGGIVVIEEFAEGIRPYWGYVKQTGNLMENLTDSYFMQRIPPAWFRPGRERLDFLVNLARDFNVS